MEPRTLLRLEGLAALALAPDLSMLGSLAGPRVGSWSYNAFHTYTLPLALGDSGFWGGSRLALLVALVWTGHIGADRLFGYGLTFESGFTQIHLSVQPAPVSAFTAEEWLVGTPVQQSLRRCDCRRNRLVVATTVEG
jgi:hypothetical protein